MRIGRRDDEGVAAVRRALDGDHHRAGLAGGAPMVQLVSFAVARAFVASNPLVGWGLGSMVRFAAVIGHAVLGVPVLGVPSGAALMSLAVFLFVTMVLDPLFLRP